jgi:hypothetical protein
MSPGRFWLGMAQMAAATTAVVLLFMVGMSTVTILMTILATGLTLASRRLYRLPRTTGAKGRPKIHVR